MYDLLSYNLNLIQNKPDQIIFLTLRSINRATANTILTILYTKWQKSERKKNHQRTLYQAREF